MTAAAVLPRRLSAAVIFLLMLVLVAPATTRATSHDAELMAILRLPQGEIDFELEPGKLHFFDEENAPFMVQIIDGCAVSGHFWAFGAGLGPDAAPLTIIDQRSGRGQRIVLPAYQPGEPIGTVVDPEALAICDDAPRGGLPEVGGTATYTASAGQCRDFSDSIELISDGREDGFRRMVRGGFEEHRVVSDLPITIVDESPDWDELHLLAEGRTPRRVEGVVFSGEQGMLPKPARLQKALKDITRARVRRAFEAAKAWKIPKPLIEDLGLDGVDCVHHVSLELDTLGASAYLEQASWIKDGGTPLALPQPVEERFTVELVRADGASTRLPLTGPLVGSDDEGLFWQYESDEAKAQIIDGCELSDSFWTIAAARIDEPVELVIIDTWTGTTTTHVLWTDREEIARLSDTASLAACP